MTAIPSAPADLFHRTLHTLRLVRDATRMFREMVERHGDPFLLPTLDETYVIAGSPGLVGEIFAADPDVMAPPSGVVEPLLGNDTVVLARGARHRRKRRVLAPPLHGARIKTYGDAVVTAARRAFEGLRPAERFEVLNRTQRLSLDIIVRAIFGMTDPGRIDRFQAAVSSVIERFPAWLMFCPWLHRPLGGLGPWDHYQRAAKLLTSLLLEEIEAARRGAGDRDDILSLLLSARDEDGQPLPKEELLDELRTLIIAGHETTATSLGWALYRLHRSPLALARLRDELGALGPTPAPEALAALPYLAAVCDETLRMHPIVPILARRLAADWQLGDHTIAAGTMICPAVMLTHFDPSIFPDPGAFRPERFLARRPGPGEFYPYGGGARRCLGAALAGFELKVALGTILATSAFEALSGPEIATVMNGVTTRPARKLWLRVASPREALVSTGLR